MIIKENNGMKKIIKSEVAVVTDEESIKNKINIQKVKKVIGDIFGKTEIVWTAWILPPYQDVNLLKDYCRKMRVAGIKVFICFAKLPALPINISLFTGMARPIIWVTTNRSCLNQVADIREPVVTAGVGEEGLRKAAMVACQIVSQEDTNIRLKFDKLLKAIINY